jgi:hypothetical protein
MMVDHNCDMPLFMEVKRIINQDRAHRGLLYTSMTGSVSGGATAGQSRGSADKQSQWSVGRPQQRGYERAAVAECDDEEETEELAMTGTNSQSTNTTPTKYGAQSASSATGGHSSISKPGYAGAVGGTRVADERKEFIRDWTKPFPGEITKSNKYNIRDSKGKLLYYVAAGVSR